MCVFLSLLYGLYFSKKSLNDNKTRKLRILYTLFIKSIKINIKSFLLLFFLMNSKRSIKLILILTNNDLILDMHFRSCKQINSYWIKIKKKKIVYFLILKYCYKIFLKSFQLNYNYILK